MGKLSGLIHKKHRRGKKRRDRLRLAARVALYLIVLGCAAGLSAGIVHVVERPVPPFKALATPPAEGAAALAPAASGEASGADAEVSLPAAPVSESERSTLATASAGSAPPADGVR